MLISQRDLCKYVLDLHCTRGGLTIVHPAHTTLHTDAKQTAIESLRAVAKEALYNLGYSEIMSDISLDNKIIDTFTVYKRKKRKQKKEE